MNFNIYLKKNTGEGITRAAKSFRRTRNSIVNEAVEEWLERHSQTEWPKDFFDFEPFDNVPDFKALRKELKDNVSEDPLA